jgi:hypothetical protein
MMDPVADNEHPREQPSVPPSEDSAAPAAPPPAVRPPTEITPDQIRQFQEFQRFQELMREQGVPPGTPPPPGFVPPWGQPPKESLPKRLLKATASKVITGLVVLAVLVIAGYLAVNYFFGEDTEQPPAHETGGGKTTDNLILDTNPYEAVRKVYHHIANGTDGVPEQVCLRFQDRGKKFAEDMGYDNCTDAVHGLARQVTDADAYAESMPSYTTTFDPNTNNEVRISSCADNIRGGIQGGPPLGVFTVKKISGSKSGQWIITDHENEPPCTTASTTPTS